MISVCPCLMTGVFDTDAYNDYLLPIMPVVLYITSR